MKKKFNIFDAVIILAIIGLVVGVVLKFFVLRDTAVTSEEKQSVQVTYTVQLNDVRQYIVDVLQENDIVYLSENTGDDDTVKSNKIIRDDLASCGTITAVKAENAKALILQDDGTISEGTCEERYDLTLTITADGAVDSDGKVSVNGYNLMVNKRFPFYTEYYANTGIISSVTTAA